MATSYNFLFYCSQFTLSFKKKLEAVDARKVVPCAPGEFIKSVTTSYGTYKPFKVKKSLTVSFVSNFMAYMKRQ